MKYKVIDDDEVFDEIDEAVDYCICDDYHDYNESDFEDWVNEHYDYVYIGGITYYPYDILNEFGNLGDVIEDYRDEMNDKDRDDAVYELRMADPGQEVECQAYTILVMDDDTGDFDGDDTYNDASMDEVRRYYDEQHEIEKLEREKQENAEKDIMSLFQHVGG